MNVNEKGNIGLIKVIENLSQKNYECFLPFTDYNSIDLIAVKNNKIYKLQIKYRAAVNGRVDIPLASVVNGKKIPIDKSKIDGWAVYCPDIDCVTYVPITYGEGNTSIVSYRIEPALKQVKTKHYTEFGEVAEWSIAAIC